MTRFMKTTAIAALVASTAMPAFAAGHADVSTMTCGMYNELSQEDKDSVAMAAVLEITNMADGTIAPNNGEATATDPLEGETAEESPSGSTNTLAENDGTAMATSTVPAGDDKTQYQEKIDLLNLTCERNVDTMVMEAAAGQSGTK